MAHSTRKDRIYNNTEIHKLTQQSFFDTTNRDILIVSGAILSIFLLIPTIS